MIGVEVFEGKTREEALEKALIKYQTEEDKLFIKEEYIEGKLFKSAKYQLTILEKEKVKKFLEDFFNQLSKNFKLTINNEIREEDGIYNILLVSNNNNVLIGKEGKNLEAIQYLIRQIFEAFAKTSSTVVITAESPFPVSADTNNTLK